MEPAADFGGPTIVAPRFVSWRCARTSRVRCSRWSVAARQHEQLAAAEAAEHGQQYENAQAWRHRIRQRIDLVDRCAMRRSSHGFTPAPLIEHGLALRWPSSSAVFRIARSNW